MIGCIAFRLKQKKFYQGGYTEDVGWGQQHGCSGTRVDPIWLVTVVGRGGRFSTPHPPAPSPTRGNGADAALREGELADGRGWDLGGGRAKGRVGHVGRVDTDRRSRRHRPPTSPFDTDRRHSGLVAPVYVASGKPLTPRPPLPKHQGRGELRHQRDARYFAWAAALSRVCLQFELVLIFHD